MKTIPNWSDFIARIWSNLLQATINNGDTIVEVAPGGTDKIARALAILGFKGTIILIEPEELAIRTSRLGYSKLLPNCNIISLQCTVSEAIKSIPDTSIIVANHPLDDMIIGNTLTASDFSIFFNNHYEKEIEHTERLWNRLNRNQIERSAKVVYDEWYALTTKAKKVVISQYESYFFQQNNFRTADAEALALLNSLKYGFSGTSLREGNWLTA